ncbi:MAG: trypsin-like serine protease [Burkholderiales bacterium]|nr:trypsin-like serine protease [Burkholderiales bacterium]
MNTSFKRVALAALLVAGCGAASAVTVSGNYTPLISAGAPPDSPGARVDPNVASSAYSGVVSINIRYDGKSFICSGTLVSKRDVVSAGHCVDTDGNGHVVDLTKPGTDVRVVFNASPIAGDPGRAIVTADKVTMNPNYQGFGHCPAGVAGFCVNDDVSVIHMNADAPAAAKIYKVWGGAINTGQHDYLAGYGTSGDGISGYTVGPDFRIKRSGENYIDLFDTDDEANFSAASPKEVWYSDFDGTDAAGVAQDSFCVLFGVCTPVLANNKETNIGGGDSGGPSFMGWGDELVLFGNNTFGGTFDGQVPGTFGTYFGGILLDAYIPFLLAATDGRIDVIPEPDSVALVMLGLLGAGASVRRRKTAAA